MIKKLLSATLLAITAFYTSNAQITITAADFPVVGNLVIRAVDDVTVVAPGTPGLNQVWDLGNLSATGYDSAYYLSPAGLPYSQNYPEANMVESHNPGGVNYNYAFLQTTPAGTIWHADEQFIILFADFSMTIHTIYNPQPVKLPLPFTYGSNNVQSTGYTFYIVTKNAGVLLDSVKTVSVQTITMNGDAAGTMILPDGSFPVIRVKESISSSDSSYTWNGSSWTLDNDTAYSWNQYRWYANDLGEVGYLSENQKKSSGFTFFKSESLVGTKEKMSFPVTIAPNPVVSDMNIRTSGSITGTEIYDLSGRLVLKGTGNRINVDCLPDGEYIAKIYSGAMVSSVKFLKR